MELHYGSTVLIGNPSKTARIHRGETKIMRGGSKMRLSVRDQESRNVRVE